MCNYLIISKMKNSRFCDLYIAENQDIGYGPAEKLPARKFGGGLYKWYLCNRKSVGCLASKMRLKYLYNFASCKYYCYLCTLCGELLMR